MGDPWAITGYYLVLFSNTHLAGLLWGYYGGRTMYAILNFLWRKMWNKKLINKQYFPAPAEMCWQWQNEFCTQYCVDRETNSCGRNPFSPTKQTVCGWTQAQWQDMKEGSRWIWLSRLGIAQHKLWIHIEMAQDPLSMFLGKVFLLPSCPIAIYPICSCSYCYDMRAREPSLLVPLVCFESTPHMMICKTGVNFLPSYERRS